jgi:hypothetical protein
MKMPVLNVSTENLSQEQKEIVSAITGQQSRLRSSKPKINGLAMYVWRMVAFQVSPNSQHHCMPMTADFDLGNEYWPQGFPTYSDFNDPNRVKTAYEIESDNAHNKRKAKIAELDVLVNIIVNSVPKEQWYGVSRWGRALGHL